MEVKQKYRLGDWEKPYQNAIDSFNTVTKFQTPLEKLNAFLSWVSLMKTDVVDYWKNKEEIGTMDDELPIIVFIVSRSTVPNLFAEVRYL